MGEKKLTGVRVAVLATDGFEESELTEPVRVLHEQGAKVSIVSLERGRIHGMKHLKPGCAVKVDRTIDQVKPADFDALVLPGGLANPDTLRQNEKVRAFVRAFDQREMPIAVICHGAWVLASSGVMQNRRLTSWPGIQDDVRNAGGQWLNQEVVRDRNWVSSRDPKDLPAFTREMVSLFASRKTATEIIRRSEPARFNLLFAWLGRGAALALAGFMVRRFAPRWLAA